LDLPQLFYKGLIEVFSSPGAILTFIFFFLMVLFYIYIPFDLIPDTFGFVGFIDDFILILGAIIWVVEKFYSRFRAEVNNDYENIRAR
jgi:uncharacterized membrane protein YkvA (DUF1232 family)